MQEFRNIDIEILSTMAEPDSIKDFYLSDGSYLRRFTVKGASLLFNGFAIFLCTSGTGVIKISGREYTLSKGSLMIYTPNQLMEMIDFSEDWSRKTIILSMDRLLDFPSPIDANILNFARHTPVVNVSESMMLHLCEYYNFIQREYWEADNRYRKEITKSLLFALILEICGIYQSANQEEEDSSVPKQEKIFDKFISLLGKHYKEERSITFYAEQMHLTSKYLSTSIKRISGRTAAEWIREVVICEIKTLLKTTDYTILEISELLNFTSPSIFVQYFKHYTGTSPHKYRAEM